MAGRSTTTGEPRLGESRRSAIVEMLRARGAVSVTEIQEHLGVSPMTARRDLAELARRGIAQRTHGGAVLPPLSAEEDSFSARLGVDADAKGAIAEAAVTLLSPHDAVFLDSSTTTFYAARRILELGLELTIVTNSLPVMELVAVQAAPNIELVAVGGALRGLTRSFVGPYAVRTVEGHFADHVLFSVKAIAGNGMLTDADPLEAEVKRAMIAQARQSILLVDGSKLSARGLNAIAPVSDISIVLAHGIPDGDLRQLRRFDAVVQVVDEPAVKPPAHGGT